ncbi:uncharacterized protein TRIADDRAFT_55137 [Trichoplax adhaerens]|uniref:Testis expressed 9 n=1 Tax=Trichoplax adhaerens TaxID=10228 RepID=B3RU31_TRIAD|nr:hypothetical protein TRIADDRAFT_55137 [Trichoplax adhaerens]EDV25272.1 hypothetical protein TRIADDRAFT_55137 [Trichoplax adhaerens]|eukprot:XP_002111305.1 hypothetical protein TRIADDRAFT_55137 [Trichoplax adhaerens]
MASTSKTLGKRASSAFGRSHGYNNSKEINWPTSSSSSSRQRTSSAQNSKRPSSRNSNTTEISQGILEREQELMQRNAELEQRAAVLEAEAAEILNRQDEILLDENRDIEFEDEDTNFEEFIEAAFEKNKKVPQKSKKKSSIPKSNNRKLTPTNNSSRSLPAKKNKLPPKEKEALEIDNLDSDADEITLAQRILELEEEIDKGKKKIDYKQDDILPAEASEMGTEATIRFLKAKIRVMQEELERLMMDCNLKDEKVTRAESKAKTATEEQTKLQRLNQNLQSQLDKYKKVVDENKKKGETLEAQLTTLRKELDSSQRSQKQTAVNHNAVEVRLNRALEENEKLKLSMQKAKVESKDSKVHERKRIEQLHADNKRLEKQKNELMNGFKKQLKLIDILKKQKMHIEAAKLLSFTEEEFVRALDWGS